MYMYMGDKIDRGKWHLPVITVIMPAEHRHETVCVKQGTRELIIIVLGSSRVIIIDAGSLIRINTRILIAPHSINGDMHKGQ